MLGLASISDRIHTLEQTLQRAAHTPQQLPTLHFPDAQQSTSTGAGAGAGAAPSSSSSSAASVAGQLAQLSSAFQQILSSHSTVHEYLSRASSIESLVESQSDSASAGGVGADGSSSRVRGELEVVLSASESLESTARMLQQLQALMPVLDNKWPVEDFSALSARVSAVESLLPRQAFEAAQSHVQLERFLSAYNSMLDFLSRQFVLWNQQLDSIETQIDAKLARSTMQTAQ